MGGSLHVSRGGYRRVWGVVVGIGGRFADREAVCDVVRRGGMGEKGGGTVTQLKFSQYEKIVITTLY